MDSLLYAAYSRRPGISRSLYLQSQIFIRHSSLQAQMSRHRHVANAFREHIKTLMDAQDSRMEIARQIMIFFPTLLAGAAAIWWTSELSSGVFWGGAPN